MVLAESNLTPFAFGTALDVRKTFALHHGVKQHRLAVSKQGYIKDKQQLERLLFRVNTLWQYFLPCPQLAVVVESTSQNLVFFCQRQSVVRSGPNVGKHGTPGNKSKCF